jgi:hypothetical protein
MAAMNTKSILNRLDKHASEFNFPVLDNAYVELAASRMSSFRGPEEWLLIFEVLGFSTREVEFVDDFYAYGSCVEREGIIGEAIPLTSDPNLPIFDLETNECIADWRHWSIKLGGQTMSFTPTAEEYLQAGIEVDPRGGTGSIAEIDLLRFLVRRLGEKRLFMDDETLLSNFPHCIKMSRFLQTSRWQHPNIADGETPSDNPSIRSLIDALSRKDPEAFDPGRPNTDWKFWTKDS